MKAEFKEDTVFLFYGIELSQKGIFIFIQNKDTLTIIKASGPGGCPVLSKGIYTIETLENGKKFSLHLVSDECPQRIPGFTANPYERIHPQNSISNTKWKGTLLIPHAADVSFTFKKDTLYITTETSEEVGTILFTQRNDTLVISKLSGPSPCPEQAQGFYLIEWFDNGNKFRLHGIRDECEGRIGVFTVNPFERVRDKQ